MIHEPTGIVVEKVRYKAGLLKFASLYTTNRLWLRYLIIVLFSLLTGILAIIFEQKYEFITGITGLSQGIARIVQSALIAHNQTLKQAKLAYDILF